MSQFENLSEKATKTEPTKTVFFSLLLVIIMMLTQLSSVCQAGNWNTVGSMATARSQHTATLLLNGNILVTGGSISNYPYTAASAEIYNPATNRWSSAGSMADARFMHTATLLPNGKVLVAGGRLETNISADTLSSAELYDPATNSWSSAGSMAIARELHTATLLPNGKLLVAGGYQNSSAEIYDPVTNRWSWAGSMTAARMDHTATLLPSGKVLVVGGYNEPYPIPSAEIYDPATNRWNSVASMAIARSYHTAILLPNGKVLVAGGTGGSSAELYDPASNSWSSAGSLATGRKRHTATFLPNGKVLVAGGETNLSLSSVELYDQASNSWSADSSLLTPRSEHTATLLPNGKVLMTGGSNYLDGYHFSNPLSNTETYDSSANSWRSAGFMTAARDLQTATLLTNGKVLLTGGNNGGALSGVEQYDPPNDIWNSDGAMTTARYQHTAILLPNGKVLVAGGFNNTDGSLFGAEQYDPAIDSWSSAGSLATAREYHTATLLGNGKVLVAGGETSSNGNGNPLVSAELFDPASNSWSLAGSMAIARKYHTATLLPNGKVLVTGGHMDGTLFSAELYDPDSNSWSSAGSMATAREHHTATLLQSGKVLVTGGNNGGALSSAELYDPASNSWTSAGSLATAREQHTATLFFNGMVMVAGGMNSSQYLSSAELYDPVTNRWTAAGSLSTPRYRHSATLLFNGKVLVAGGSDGSGSLPSAEIFDFGLGFNDSRRPVISNITSLSDNLVLTGTGFVGDSEGSGGSTNNSSTKYPLVQLYRMNNGQQAYVLPAPAASWSGTSVTIKDSALSGLTNGPYLAIVYANAIPSMASYWEINLPPNAVVTPISLDYSNVDIDSTSTRAITLSNNGNEPLRISSLSFSGTDAGMFTQSAGGSCGATLAVGRSCTINITFAPTTAGNKSALLSVITNNPTPITVNLTGSGIALSPVTVATPNLLDYGGVNIYSASTRSVTLSNSGNRNLQISSLSFSGTDAGLFSTSADGTCGATLTPGASCTINITFAPTTGGSKSALLSIISNNPTPISINLSGSGIVVLAISGHQPANGAIVQVNTTVQATFSEPLNPDTISMKTFYLSPSEAPKAIAAGGFHSVALKVDGTVVAWGYNNSGQTSVPAGLAGVTAIAAGGSQTLALRNDGTVVAWGSNTYGQSSVPTGLTGVIAIAAGGNHSVALKGDGTVVAWGYNSSGQTTPPAGLSGVIAIAAGSEHTLALKSDGTVVAWGDNTYGESTVPAGLTGVTAIAVGYYRNVALKNDGTLVAWGYNGQGESTLPANLTGVIAISAGLYYTAALKNDGTVVSWGNLGVPAGLTGVTAIAAGWEHTVAMKSDGTLAAWVSSSYDYDKGQATIPVEFRSDRNANINGTFIYDAASRTATFTPSALLLSGVTYYATVAGVTNLTGVPLAAPVNWSFKTYDLNITTAALSFETGTGYSQPVIATGGLAPYSWSIISGALPAGLALDNATGIISGTSSAAGTAVITIQVIDENAIIVSKTLTLTTHPAVTSYQPAKGATVSVDAILQATFSDPLDPATVTTSNVTLSRYGAVSAIAAGGQQAAALKNDGTLVSWGYNNGSMVPAGLTGVTAIAKGGSHTVALKNDGTVVAWGPNNSGEATVPAGLTGVTAIAAAYYHTLALKNDGTVVAWGHNSQGESTVPAGLTGVTAIAAGIYFSVALKNDGTVVAWGGSNFGHTKVPADLTGVTAIAAGGYHTVALKADGSVVEWDDNGYHTIPAGLTGVTAIATGLYHTVALKNDGTVVAWGRNTDDNGRTTGQATVPAGLTGVTAIAAGDYHTVALKRDGTLVAWGDNSSGQTTVPAGLSSSVNAVSGTLTYDTAALTVTFTPSAPLLDGATYYATIAGITSLTGVPIAAPVCWSFTAVDTTVSVAPTAYDFGNVVINSSPLTRTFTLGNANSTSLTINTITIAGADAALFSITSGTCSSLTPTIVPGESCSVNVTFATTAIGPRSATLQVTSNPSANHTVNVALSGSVVASIPKVISYQPTNGAVAPVNAKVQATFSEPMDTSSITSENFTLARSGVERAIAAGSYHTVALKTDGTVVTWGYNYSAQTTAPAGLSGVIAVAAGSDHTVALKADSTVVAWGWNGYGQTTIPAGLSGVMAISAGYSHTVALKNNGTVVAWGNNDYGQTTVPAGLAGVIAIGAGGSHTVALKTDGTVVAWGYNGGGQTTVPPGLIGVTAIAAGGYHTVALKNDGTVVAWGSNGDGQTTIPQGLTGVTAIAAGRTHTVALKQDGTVVAWGDNHYGQTTSPAGLTGVVAIAAGKEHTVALKNNGSLAAWGLNYTDSYDFSGRIYGGQATVPAGLTAFVAPVSGLLTYDPTSLTATFTPSSPLLSGFTYNAAITGIRSQTGVPLAGPVSWSFRALDITQAVVPLSYDFGNVIINSTPANKVFTISNSNSGNANLVVSSITLSGSDAEMFNVSPGTCSSLTPTIAAGSSCTFNVIFAPTAIGPRSVNLQIASNAGINPLVSISLQGAGVASIPTVTNYQPANGATVPITTTVQATFSEPIDPATVTAGNFTLSRFGVSKSITAGKLHSVALMGDGTVVAWGANWSGQTTVPAGLTGVTAIAAGGDHAVALKNDGTMVAWGYNYYGQTTIPAGLTGVTAIAAGGDQTVALKNDGTVVAWGYNTVPTGLTGVTAIAAGGYHTVALKSDGTVVAWGDNSAGQSTVPAGLIGVKAIAAGYSHTVALKNDGTVVAWGWGAYNYGQSTVPAGLTGVTAIAAGFGHTVALKSDGTVVAWGYNSAGQTTVPVGLTGVTAIAAGWNHTVALKSDGSVVAWGNNDAAETLVPACLSPNGNAVSGAITYDPSSLTATFTPSAPVLNGITYHATVAGITSQIGVPLAVPVYWSFKTCDPLTITTSVLLYGTTGNSYRLSLTATGGFAPYTWAITSGALPAGLTLDSGSGVISGTLNAAGTAGFTIQVTDANATIISKAITLSTYLTVTGFQPGNSATVPINTTVQATFSEPINAATITTGNFSLSRGGAPKAITAGKSHSVVLKADGTVVAWGDNGWYQTNVPAGLTGVVAIAAGDSHTLALKNDGTVVAWGWWSRTWIPAGLTGVTAIAAGGDHSLALKSDGTVVAWGDNSAGQTTVPAGLAGVAAIAAGSGHTVALKNDGTVVAWGYNGYGQTTVPAGLTGVTAIAAGCFHTVALKSDGTVVAWGDNSLSQTAIPAGLTGVKAISAKDYYTVALKNDGTVVAWGTWQFWVNSTAWVPTGLTGVTAIAAGWRHIVALKNDGTVVAWGDNNSGQTTIPAGLSSTENAASGTISYDEASLTATFKPSAPLLNGVTYYATVAGVISHTGAPLAAPVNWSFRTYDALNITTAALPYGTTGTGYSQTLIAIGGIAPYSWSITSGSLPVGVSMESTTGLISGTPTATGSYTFTIQATDITTATMSKLLTINIYDPVTITTTALPFAVTGATYNQTLTATGGLAPYRWSIVTSFLPAGISLNASTGVISGIPTATGKFTFIVTATDANSAYVTQSFSIDALNPLVISTNNLYCPVGIACSQRVTATGGTPPYYWEITSGTLPANMALDSVNGIISGTSTAVEIAGFTIQVTDANATIISKTLNFTIPLTVAGYQPANGASVPVNTSVTVTFSDPLGPATVTADILTLSRGEAIKAIVAGGAHTVALKSNGTMIAWGNNYSGQTTIPAGLTGVIAIAAGGSHTVALKNDGTVVAWGYNNSGQTTVPTNLTGVISIAAGGSHTVALKNDGTVVAWGNNYFGQTTVPAGLTGVAAIAAGVAHTVALKNDGTVVAWGYNDSGQTTVPVGLTGVIALAAGCLHTVALKNDGTVVAWGSNNYGQTSIPPGLSGVTAIAAGDYHTVALKNDGTVVAWGYDYQGQSSVPAGLTRVIAISAGGSHAVALKYNGTDGTVVTWGDNSYGQNDVPADLSWTIVSGSVAYDPATLTATFTPLTPLVVDAKYFASVTGGVPLANPFYWSFTATNKPPLTILLTGNGSGTVHSSPSPDIRCFSGSCSQHYPQGTIVTLTATPINGFVFTGWMGACTGSGQCQVTMDAGKVVWAKFTQAGDSTPPTVTSFTMASSATALSVPITTFNASDNLAVTGYLVTESPIPPSANSAGWSSSVPSSLTFSAPGNCYAYAWARDDAGNVSTSSVAMVNIALNGSNDTSTPYVTSFSLPSSTILSTPITSLAVTDNLGVTGYLVSENGTTPLASDSRWSNTPPVYFTFNSFGNKTLYAWAKDAAGNVSARASATCMLMDPAATLDTMITGGPADLVTTAPSAFTFIANKVGASIECSLDSGSFFACASPVSFGTLANGSHTFSVRSKEGAVYDQTPASYTWTVSIPIVRINLNAYTSIANAYAASSDGHNLEIKGLEFREDITFDRPISITLKGGYDAGYQSTTGTTAIHGTLIISDGTVTVENITIM